MGKTNEQSQWNRGKVMVEYKELITVCVCTYKRPKMLRECIQSIRNTFIPYGYMVDIVVVDNEGHEDVVDMCKKLGCFYVYEKKRGISFARNTAIETALELNTDWIVFIDDDELAAPAWLEGLMNWQYIGTPILAGNQRYAYEKKPRGYWDPENRRRPFKEGRTRNTCCTNNVRINASILEKGVRFNETIGFMGGEDIEFFSRLRAKGYVIRQTNLAITYERIHPERQGFKANFYRWLWSSASDMVALRNTRGLLYTIFRKGLTIPINLILGLITIPYNPKSGCKKIAKAIGRSMGFLGIFPQPYLNTVGE